mgnify:CR=1 FL=1
MGVGLYALGMGLGVGLIVIGASYGIGTLAKAALESTGRQPEAAGNIFTQMLVAAALIEGFTFFAIFVFFQGIGKVSTVGMDAGSQSQHADRPAAEKNISEVS